MRVLIVDDEPAARQRLAIMLEDLDVEVVGAAGDGLAALKMAREHRPDVVLLDIAMPEVDGFDVARRLPEPRPLVIFQTAHDEHAVRAFEHEAIDYVLKPVTAVRLAQALERARRLTETPAAPPPETLERIRTAIEPATASRLHRILVRYGSGHQLLALDGVMEFRAEEGEIWARTATATYLLDYTLAELEHRAAGGFMRVNRSQLVALAHVEKVHPAGDGALTLTLTDGGTVSVSRRRAPGVRRALEG